MAPVKARKQRLNSEVRPLVTGSPLKRSRGVATAQEPESISLHTGLALQASLNGMREKMSAPTTTSFNLNPLQQYREPETSSVASSEQIPTAYSFTRVASTDSLTSSCESYATAVSTHSMRALELPPAEKEYAVVNKLRFVSSATNGTISSIPQLLAINRKHQAFKDFKQSDEAKAVFYALMTMQSNPSASFYEPTFSAAYIFFGIVYAYRHGFLSINDIIGGATLTSPTKRSKTNQGLASVLSYDLAYKQALLWKNALARDTIFFTSKDYSHFATAAQNARLL